MTEKEKVQIAMSAMDKNLSYEELYYSDYMYGNEEQTDEVWEYVNEAREEGMKYFLEKYQDKLL